MATYEEVLDNVTLQASEIIARKNQNEIVSDLYNVISEKCENGDLINELNGIERIFYLCQTFESEMNNGGIYHFYQSVSGNFANETVEALLEIGAKHTALILDKGNSLFKEGIVPEDQDARIEEIENLDYRDVSWLFDELDREFYLYEDNLGQMNLEYVLANKEAFM
ncbi:DMP19 family protein [Candidatus Stoquefichus massiliensis]|uniref:DMP19 family protein n=1 Tax=Candidatus Stoquefichus massiliensis TaxID=1470350 RepID=UPI000489F07A|nr:DMP19 family protein [Candidatus Stoquefichus massiliensis]